MKLIGLLDSPYVRRVAISLQSLGLPFEHRPLSVFRHVADFGRINPVVKAPTLVCDDGTVLMDSSLILAHAEAVARPRSLMPADLAPLTRALRLIGLALAACEKNVQLICECEQRPADKRHEPWVARVTSQMLAAYDALEAAVAQQPPAMGGDAIDQAGITAAVTWHFTQQTMPERVPAVRHPALAALSQAAEALPAFRAAPHGDGVCLS